MKSEDKDPLFVVMFGDDVLVDDGTARLTLTRDVGVDGAFGISAADDGGFTGVLLTRDCWLKMRAKVDAFLIEKFADKCTEEGDYD